jgi:RNA polymerase sigma factor (sigma-70 family)
MQRLPEERLCAENKLLNAFLQADNEAILMIYKSCLPMVSKYICGNGGSHDDARDVFQEALMALYKQAQSSKFVLTASVSTYIFSICRYQWLKTLRKNKKVESLVESFDLQDDECNIIVHLEKSERFLILQNHLSKLKGNNRKILELHFQKYSTNEIAEQLGLSRLYVKKKKFECKKQLIDSIKMDLRYLELKQD